MKSKLSKVRLTANNSSANRGKKIWTLEEDNRLRMLVETHGTSKWAFVSSFMPGRSGKQCRERFHNHLDVGIVVGEWTPEEDKIVFALQHHLGNLWSKIAALLPGRTDNSVKNRFHVLDRAKRRNTLDTSFLEDTEYINDLLTRAQNVLSDDDSDSVENHDNATKKRRLEMDNETDDACNYNLRRSARLRDNLSFLSTNEVLGDEDDSLSSVAMACTDSSSISPTDSSDVISSGMTSSSDILSSRSESTSSPSSNIRSGFLFPEEMSKVPVVVFPQGGAWAQRSAAVYYMPSHPGVFEKQQVASGWNSKLPLQAFENAHPTYSCLYSHNDACNPGWSRASQPSSKLSSGFPFAQESSTDDVRAWDDNEQKLFRALEADVFHPAIIQPSPRGPIYPISQLP